MTALFLLSMIGIAGLVLIGRPLWLLLAVLFIVFIPVQDMQLAGVRLDLDDITLAGLFMTMLRYPAFFRRAMRRIPYFGLWLALGGLMTVAYVSAPINSPYLTDPVRTVYQLVRYCWKPILFYPLAVMLLSTDERRRDFALHAVVVAGILASIQAAYQGYTDLRVQGPFQGGNALGGALIGPFILAAAACIYARTRRQFWLAIAATLLCARGLLFSSSRGAFVGMLAGMALFGGFLLWSTVARRRLIQLFAMACLAVMLAFAAKPNLLQRPNVKALFSAVQGTEDANFQWRLTRRWPYFWERLKVSPWLGVGTDKDLTLSYKDQGNTPHNGYLSLSLMHGVPAAMLFLSFAALAIRNGILVFRRDPVPKHRIQGLAVAAVVFGILIHNIVESTVVQPFVGKLYWFLVAIAAGRWAPNMAYVQSSVRARVPRRAAIGRPQPARPQPARTRA